MYSPAVRVLLVEDNEDDALIVREAFQATRLAHLLDVVRDGEETMSYLRRDGRFRGAPRPNLLLLDINMPKMDGFEVLRELKADPDLRSIPVLILTSSDREEDVVRSYSEGASTFITKPYRYKNFVRVMKQVALYWGLAAAVPAEAHAKQN
ncbi:MAG: response regulator [Nitrospirae bacterium]|nr:response regulator [Nitrospirota bacterium]